MIALLYALVPSVSSAYWILGVMTTQVYLIVYLLMFVAALSCAATQPDVERGCTGAGAELLCVVGFLASAAAIMIGFVPPSQFENGSAVAYGALILAGTFLIGPAAAVVVPEVPEAQLEARRAGGERMSASTHACARNPPRTTASASSTGSSAAWSSSSA